MNNQLEAIAYAIKDEIVVFRVLGLAEGYTDDPTKSGVLC